MKVELTAEQLQVVLAGLAELPLKVSAHTFQSVQQQAQEAGLLDRPTNGAAPVEEAVVQEV